MAALVLSMLLVVVKLVPVKMLPFDNKNEFLMLVDMPKGTTLEGTDKVVTDLERYLATVNEVRDLESYVGVGLPWILTEWCASTTCARGVM